MNALDFFFKRFGIPEKINFEIGDEVIDEYGMKAVVIREPYYIKDEEFTLIFYGRLLSSTTTKKLTKTGKNHKEIVDLLIKLNED